jgi:hypothetical protein
LASSWAHSANEPATQPASFSTGKLGAVAAQWKLQTLPERYAKPATEFAIVDLDRRQVLEVKAEKSWGSLGFALQSTISPNTQLNWTWRLDQALEKADIRQKPTEDSPLKVCASFDMPVSAIPGIEQAGFRFAQLLTRERLPTATICYVWGNIEPVNLIQASLFTRRVVFIVVDNKESSAKTWITHSRNLHADFLKAFGAETLTVPPVRAILVGADSDNTTGQSMGYISDLKLKP